MPYCLHRQLELHGSVLTSPWLSVVIPVHNGEHFLAATLESVAGETPEGVEFLIFDSSEDLDSSKRIVERFSDRLDLRWTAAAHTPSWTAKTNHGVSVAKAPYVAMLHQDDLWLPGHLQSVQASLTATSDFAMSIGPSVFVDAKGRSVGHWQLPFAPGVIQSDLMLSTLIVQNSIAVPAPIIKRALWASCRGLEEDLWYTADWDLYLKLAQLGSVHVRRAETTAFRIHGSSLTMTGARDAAAFRDQHELVLARHLPLVPAADRPAVQLRARASIEVNCLLASASRGEGQGAGRTMRALARLGPAGALTYLRQSRLIDRLLPRMRLKLRGAL